MDTLVAGFGEIMLRLSPKGMLRFSQALPGELDATFGGGEANVCVSLANFGMMSRYLSALPENPIADALTRELRGIGVDTARILRAKSGRLGIYFAEAGANQRGASVVYDRAASSIALAKPADYDFGAMLENVTWLHLTGITPALSENAFLSTLAIAEKAAAAGIKISCDLNYRKKLWGWRQGTQQKALARECMGAIVALANVIIGNEEDAADVFGIHAEGADVESGRLNTGAYAEVARKLAALFPKAAKVAITLRESISASHNNWGAMLYDTRADAAHFAPLAPDGVYKPFEIRDIVDRIGGGDSFAAGLIYALNTEALAAPDNAIAFAVAASCLKHSISGDYNRCGADEVLVLMKGGGSGRVSR
ncbi:MAG: sugar kinase [Kiritimatiellaeota bacterium]|nr:sugar kinase [Kiritimatiellota bacterium]